MSFGESTASALTSLNSMRTLIAEPRRGDDGGEPDGRSRHCSAIGSELFGYAAFVVPCIQIATSHTESFNDFLAALAHGVVQRSLVRGCVKAASTPVLAEDGQTQPQMTKVDALLRSFEQRPDFFVEVRGDSVNAVGIRDGDLVAVRRDPDPRDDDIVIARIGSEITMKRYKRGRQYIELEPQSTNPEHETIRAEVGTDVETVGVLVGAVIGTPRGNR